jgi:E3 ubiquitin-protein ligase RFWD2
MITIIIIITSSTDYRSTDSELKLWSVDTGTCVKTYRGHVNDKNFVGLTVNDDFITCGESIV